MRVHVCVHVRDSPWDEEERGEMDEVWQEALPAQAAGVKHMFGGGGEAETGEEKQMNVEWKRKSILIIDHLQKSCTDNGGSHTLGEF